MERISFTAGIVSFCLCASNFVCGQETKKERDADIFEACVRNCRENKAQPSTGELVVQAAKFFAEKKAPYVAHTLEAHDKETLIVNLKELDCTTFVENCIVIAKVVAAGNASFENYIDTLTAMRYRNGKIDGYTSRLHYTSDWIYENSCRLTDISEAMGGLKTTTTINFMSTHPQSYRHLQNDPINVTKIKAIEAIINRRNSGLPPTARSVVPTDKIPACEQAIRDGDIIAFATAIPGLDYSHLGIACRKAGTLHFIHASSKGKRVMFETKTLFDYCRSSEKCTGISILRIKD